ncbi:CHASE2 domain-containing protein [Rivularia sp. PCC 7116]|uniref:CHASE2 domain-containing protein n=1 Tax=Rivularia sp. PCC 7116 TaxID=373994 RepID=UPI0012FB8567|nr:CHASE2 domain-containing protein [Rivularia sp. PCC 7116]
MSECHIQLGKTVFKPLQPNDGNYIRAKTGGYQILLSYHGTKAQFQTFSITYLLANRIPPQTLESRIALIGATPESIKDSFLTSYSSHHCNLVVGKRQIHIEMMTQFYRILTQTNVSKAHYLC